MSDRAIEEFVTAFTVGVPKHVLAEQYGISLTRVKQLLRTYGARGQQRGRQF